jgi:DNA-binding response OmpR family regulator
MAKIMIVDDDTGATSMLERLMRMEGHIPTAINESKLVMGVADIIKPDLFILDLMMPEPTGFQLCRMLREKEHFESTPSKIVAFGAGASDFINKPFRVDDLLQKIRSWLISA